jgi:hypothetical protein
MNVGFNWCNLKERDQEDTVEVDCKQILWECMEWINVA